jgi:hypothetical protein
MDPFLCVAHACTGRRTVNPSATKDGRTPSRFVGRCPAAFAILLRSNVRQLSKAILVRCFAVSSPSEDSRQVGVDFLRNHMPLLSVTPRQCVGPGGAKGYSHGWRRRSRRNPWNGRRERTRPGGAEGCALGSGSVRALTTSLRPFGAVPFTRLRPTGTASSAGTLGVRRRRRSTRGYSPRPLRGQIGRLGRGIGARSTLRVDLHVQTRP